MEKITIYKDYYLKINKKSKKITRHTRQRHAGFIKDAN